MTVFDNEGGPPRMAPQSRALVLAVDQRRARVRLQARVPPPAPGLLRRARQRRSRWRAATGSSAGAARPTSPSTNATARCCSTAIWRRAPSSYRAFLQQWNATPTAPPDLAVVRCRGDRHRLRVLERGDRACRVESCSAARVSVTADPARHRGGRRLRDRDHRQPGARLPRRVGARRDGNVLARSSVVAPTSSASTRASDSSQLAVTVAGLGLRDRLASEADHILDRPR